MNNNNQISRRSVMLGAAGLSAAFLTPQTINASIKKSEVFGREVIIAFDGLDYPSWDDTQLHTGFMAFVSVGVQNYNPPLLLQMALQYADGSVIQVKKENRYTPYRSTSLDGTAADWAIIPVSSGTIPLFIPSACLDISKKGGFKLRLLFRVFIQRNGEWEMPNQEYQKLKYVEVSFSESKRLKQVFVAPAPTEDGAYTPSFLEKFRSSFDSTEGWESL